MFVAENPPEVAASSRSGLPHADRKPFVLDLDEAVFQRIRVIAEAKGMDHESLAKEFIVERLQVEEERVGLSVLRLGSTKKATGKPRPWDWWTFTPTEAVVVTRVPEAGLPSSIRARSPSRSMGPRKTPQISGWSFRRQ